jgi:hypothetical protein
MMLWVGPATNIHQTKQKTGGSHKLPAGFAVEVASGFEPLYKVLQTFA